MSDFDGETVIVTGASRGIGRELATRFAAQGARVVVNYLRSQADAERVVETIRHAGGVAVSCQGDVSIADDVARLVDTAATNFEGVSILVNNAGLSGDRPFLEVTEEEWDRQLAVNLKGPFLISQAAARVMMTAGRGRIINISAISGVSPRKEAASYGVAKAGLNMLTKCMALELAPRITVNAIALGLIDSPLVQELFSEERNNQTIRQTPLQRMGTFDEVWQTVRFLSGEGAAFISGQTLMVDGGRVMR